MKITNPAVDLMPGDVGFYTIAGAVGRWVSLGQALLGDECIFSHAFIVVQMRPGGTLQCVEAMPGGARLAPVSGRMGLGYGYVRLPLAIEQRDQISREAISLTSYRQGRGIGYSFADYLALALWEWDVPGSKLVRRYVERSSRMICSQLVDYVLCRAGFHAFNDGRLPQDVTPGQLWWQLGAVGQTAWWPPAGAAKVTEAGAL